VTFLWPRAGGTVRPGLLSGTLFSRVAGLHAVTADPNEQWPASMLMYQALGLQILACCTDVTLGTSSQHHPLHVASSTTLILLWGRSIWTVLSADSWSSAPTPGSPTEPSTSRRWVCSQQYPSSIIESAPCHCQSNTTNIGHAFLTVGNIMNLVASASSVDLIRRLKNCFCDLLM
jgi:hypothetical protein